MAAFGSGFPGPFGASPTATLQAQPDTFAKQFPVPLPAGEDDDEDKWEYEYSTTETETYYVTLDLTDPYHPPERKAVLKAGRSNKMIRWINPVLLMKEEEETKKMMQKQKRRRQNRVYRLGSQGLVDTELPPNKIGDEEDLEDSEEEELGSDNDGREVVQSEGEIEKVDLRDPGNVETNGHEKEDDESKSNKIQIMELHSERPMVMFKERYYDCQWASNIGTEMLFIKHDPEDKNPLPILRTLEGDVDLLAASSQRIMATEVILEEKREKNSKTKSKTKKKKTKGRRLKLKDLAIPVGRGADQERRETAKFLEELIYAKLDRGELDAVTVDAQGRKSIWKWNEFVMGENRDRMNKLKKIIRKGGEDAGEAVKQLAEIEEEEKLREENVELRHKLGGAWKYRYSDKKRKGVLARPAKKSKKSKKGRPAAKKLKMSSPERAKATPGASGTPASGIGSMANSSLDAFDSEDEDDSVLEDDISDLEGSEEGDSEKGDSDEDDSDEEDSEPDDSEGSSTEGSDSEDEDSDEDSELDDIDEMGSFDEAGHGSSDEAQFSDEDEDAHTQGDEDTAMCDNL